MLFLAVFCGFLAENWREHIIEHREENQYVKSFIEDLRSDTAEINKNVQLKLQKKQGSDSLIWYLNAPDPNQYGQRIYFLPDSSPGPLIFFRQIVRLSN